jgi:hypothetical protein
MSYIDDNALVILNSEAVKIEELEVGQYTLDVNGVAEIIGIRKTMCYVTIKTLYTHSTGEQFENSERRRKGYVMDLVTEFGREEDLYEDEEIEEDTQEETVTLENVVNLVKKQSCLSLLEQVSGACKGYIPTMFGNKMSEYIVGLVKKLNSNEKQIIHKIIFDRKPLIAEATSEYITKLNNIKDMSSYGSLDEYLENFINELNKKEAEEKEKSQNEESQTYWNGVGKHQEEFDTVKGLIPDEGNAHTEHGELLRNLINCYYDIYNNGGDNWEGNREKQFENIMNNHKVLCEIDFDINEIIMGIKAIMDEVFEENCADPDSEECEWGCMCEVTGLDDDDKFQEVAALYEQLADVVIQYVYNTEINKNKQEKFKVYCLQVFKEIVTYLELDLIITDINPYYTKGDSLVIDYKEESGGRWVTPKLRKTDNVKKLLLTQLLHLVPDEEIL